MKTYIYVLIDPLTNDIKYCGKTINIKVRYRKHLSEKTNKRKLNWIKSLKEQELKPVMEIIDEVEENWEFWEIYWISQLKTWGFELFNVSEGGGYTTVGYKHSYETRRKISKAQLGKKFSDQRRANVSKGRKGIKFSEAHIKNLSISHKGQLNENIMKKVCQISMDDGRLLNTFNSIKDALIYLNKNDKNGAISQVCKGKRKSWYGYYWCYESDYENYKFEKFKKSTQRTIIQYDKKGNYINKYESIDEASIKNNINRNGISHAANDDTSSYYEYIWLFEGEEHKLENKVKKCINKYILHQIKDQVIINTFTSIKEAEDKTKIKHISSVINGKRNSAGGFDWSKIEI